LAHAPPWSPLQSCGCHGASCHRTRRSPGQRPSGLVLSLHSSCSAALAPGFTPAPCSRTGPCPPPLPPASLALTSTPSSSRSLRTRRAPGRNLLPLLRSTSMGSRPRTGSPRTCTVAPGLPLGSSARTLRSISPCPRAISSWHVPPQGPLWNSSAPRNASRPPFHIQPGSSSANLLVQPFGLPRTAYLMPLRSASAMLLASGHTADAFLPVRGLHRARCPDDRPLPWTAWTLSRSTRPSVPVLPLFRRLTVSPSGDPSCRASRKSAAPCRRRRRLAPPIHPTCERWRGTLLAVSFTIGGGP
jgi:hypothetical protein